MTFYNSRMNEWACVFIGTKDELIWGFGESAGAAYKEAVTKLARKLGASGEKTENSEGIPRGV